VAAAGDVDFDRLVSRADDDCGSWEPFDASRETPRAGPHSGSEVIFKEGAAQQYVVEITNGPAVDDDDRYAGRILATVLGDDSGSRMYWELIDTGLAECAAMSSYEYQGTGIFMTYLCCSPEDTADNLARMQEILRDAEAGGITEPELARAKSKILSHIVVQSERPSSRLFAIGSNWVLRREYRTVREIMDRYEAVTCDDVAAVLKKYPLTASTTVAVGPLKELP
jgi:predicted Zn-dependent peptidase